jgi:replication factor C subunit 2/4
MAEKLFISKFQPIYFNDFEVNNKIIEILQTFISIDYLNLLLIGSTGSGKTVYLNAIIKEYYKGLTYSDYKDNILYINNLKEQGINYYRNEVKIFCQSSSSISNKKKIVIFDDIDLINEQSQQIFRNCIDKYNKNVHFISSTNNIQKVIESLQSRFTIIKVKPLDRELLHKFLIKIKTLENIDITEEAEQYILDICNNTTKKLINYMEKCKIINRKIDIDLAMNICTNINFHDFQKYTEFLKNKNIKDAILILYSIYDKGYSVMDILDTYFLFVKTTHMLSQEEKYNIIPFVCKYITIFYNIHENEIELALFSNNLIKIL